VHRQSSAGGFFASAHVEQDRKSGVMQESARFSELPLLLVGENAKVVQERLGHNTITITIDTYSHVIEGLQQPATTKLEHALAAGSGSAG
jgi:hypothetical protein